MKGRRVKKRSGSKASVKAFLLSFTPGNFKKYWLNKQGAIRASKLAGMGLAMMFLAVLWFAKDLPSPSKINARLGAQTTQFYDRTGKHLLYETYGNKNRRIIDFKDIPDNVKQATIAIEDKDFYKHGAFSLEGIGRAFVGVVTRDRSKGGGSTITQQYVKNALLSPEQTITRKIRELILSIIIEQFYRKDDILKLYLNEIPYGSNAYGIQAAAKTYFEKDAKDLSLDEAALLAAMPQAPSYYSPYGGHKSELEARQNLILDRMAEQGYISKSQAKAAKDEKTLDKIRPIQNLYASMEAHHFVFYLQEKLEEEYGTKKISEGGLKVITTLDYDKQKAAEEAIKKNMASVRRLGGSNSALVASDPKTGQVLAMVGSYDFSDPEFGAYNVAVAERQPGSSFKPLVYATAFGKNWGPGSTIYDVTTDFGGGYKPENYTDRTYGVQSMRTALAGSLNIPAVKALYLAGLKDSIAQAKKMGITTLDRPLSEYGLSLVLGSGEVKLTEMVNAYESFANGGKHYEPTMVMKITDARGKTIKEYKPNKKPKQALDEEVAYLISDVLSDNGARSYIFGANSPLVVPGRKAAVKTGTTENYRDAWTMGYTPSLVAGVWSGNNNNKSMTKAASSISAPIWRDFMIEALKGTPSENFERPKGIKNVTIDANTGKLATESSQNKRNDIFPSWYKPSTISQSKSAEIDKVSGKLATECTPPLARETKHVGEMHAEIPPTDPAYSRWEPPVQALANSLGFSGGGALPTESDDVHKCSDEKPKADITVTKLSGSNYRVKATFESGTFPINKTEIRLDDQIISSGTGNLEITYRITSTGGHTFKAVATDTALYQGDDSQSVNVSEVSGAVDFRGVKPSGNVSGSTVNFEWTTHPDADRYRLYLDNQPKGETSSNKINNVFVNPGSHSWYVVALASDGDIIDTTSPLSFSNSISSLQNSQSGNNPGWTGSRRRALFGG